MLYPDVTFRQFPRFPRIRPDRRSSVANDQADGSGNWYVLTLAVTKGAILGTVTSGSTEDSAAR